ncbi:D-alanyl-D-alanine carboxypeptidase [bacterium]|nr:D-alanyl-D-alanine carboxypeptidase [bacterium]
MHTMEQTPYHLETPNDPRTERLVTVTLAVVAVLSLSLVFFVYRGSRSAESAPQTAAALSAIEPFIAVPLIANAAIVYDVQSGTVLYERNADAQLPLASLTKVPLSFVVSQTLSPEATMAIPYGIGKTGQAEELRKGDIVTVQALIDYTLVASSNAGAEMLALLADRAIRDQFPEAPEGKAVVWRMNELMKELSLDHTFFSNVSGLDETTNRSGAYGSARDIAHLFAYVTQRSPAVFEKTASRSVTVAHSKAENTNDALPSIPGLVMGKTGFTDLAGGNLAIVFEIGPAHPIVIVVLGSTHEGRFDDMKALVEATHKAIAQ